MGTSQLALLYGSIIALVPAVKTWWKSGFRAARLTWARDIREGFLIAAAMWGCVVLYQFIGVIRTIDKAAQIHAPLPKSTPPAVLTVHQLYKDDFGDAGANLAETLTNGLTGEKTNFEARVDFDMPANSKFLVIFLPLMGSQRAFITMVVVSKRYYEIFDQVERTYRMSMGLPGEEMMRSRDLRFSRRIFIYHEDELDLQQRAQLETLFRQNDLVVQLRGQDYASSRTLGFQRKP